MAVGAGTVTSAALAELAHSAGAQFIVSPDTDPAVIRRTKELGMCAMPGADFVKVFPASVLGPEYIRAIRGPLGQIPLLAVGGVSEGNAAAFLQAGCMGGKLVNRDWIAAGQWDSITQLARQLVENTHA